MFLTVTKSYTSSTFISLRKFSSFSKTKLGNIVPSSSTKRLTLGLSTSTRNMSVSCTYSSENGSHSRGSSIQVHTWFFFYFLFFYLFVLFHNKNYEFLFGVLILKFLKLFMFGVLIIYHIPFILTHTHTKEIVCMYGFKRRRKKKIRNLIFCFVRN